MEYLTGIIVLMILAVANGQRSTVTSTSTVTVTKTQTSYISTYAVCASVTTEVSSTVTACRRRRQYWIDVPVYIALDEDVDDQLTQFFNINPSHTYQVEPTKSPVLGFKNDNDDDDSSFQSFVTPAKSTSPLEGSLLTPFGYGDATETRSPEPFGLAVIANAINNALIALGLANPTTFVTSTSTSTKTTTKKTTTSTKTIFLSGCSPSPFPFSTCAPSR